MASGDQIQEFSEEFQQLCLKHGIHGVFVLVKSVSEKGSLLVTGGASDLCQFVDDSLAERSVPTAVHVWANAEAPTAGDPMYEAARQHVKEMLKAPGVKNAKN